MASSGGWVPEPLFGDALAGSGGTADPIEPGWAVGNPTDVFPDSLSAPPLLGPAGTTSPPLPAVQVPAAPPPIRPAVPQPDRTGAPRFRAPGPSPARTATRPSPAPSSPRPWSQFPPPGQPATQYVPVPTSAQLAPPPGRRPTVGLGSSTGPRPMPATTPGGLVRPPAYLPNNQGSAQLRAALRQARANATRAPRTAGGPKKSTKKGKTSGLWGFLVLIAVLLMSSGLGVRIISAISDVLQRK